MRVFDLDQLTLKFERHSDAENVDFLILSDDWTKTIHLQADRTIELHSQGGLHYKTRIPRFGRALAYHFPSCDALIGGAGNEIYRLNLEQGRFMNPLVLEGDAERGPVEGVNAIDINPAHNLLAFATEGPGTVELWDPRSRSNVGILRLPKSLVAPGATSANLVLPGVDTARPAFSATALASRMDGLSLAVGTSTGHTLLYDIRSPKPYATKDQGYGLPIKRVQWIEGASSRMAGDSYLYSADKKVFKVWDRESPQENFASVTTPTDINDVCHIPGSGLFMLANEGIHMTSYYIPQLGPAPKWCSFLDNLTEEMEDQTIRSTYEDLKFVDKAELATLGLDHLLGTPALKPYMHGYFMTLKLYDAARVIANPFVYAEHRENTIKQKMEKLADSRIRTRKDNLPKVNRALAERILKGNEKDEKRKRKRAELEESATADGVDLTGDKTSSKESKKDRAMDMLADPRFKAVFENPEYEVDENSREFALLHPSQADAAQKRGRTKTAVDEEEEVSAGGMSSDDLGMQSESNEEEDKAESNSSEEDMELISLRPRRAPTEHHRIKPRGNLPKMVPAQADIGNGVSGSKRRDPTASFGQRRHFVEPNSAKPNRASEDGDIIRHGEDGGMIISYMPSSSKSRDQKMGDNNDRKKDHKKKRAGVEYLGAGLERGVERVELPESERKGRTHRRQGVRSGSKNAFRGL